MKKTLIIGTLCYGLSWSSCKALQDSSLTLAILPIKDRMGLSQAILEGMPDMIATELVQNTRARVVERSQVTNALQAQKIEGQNLGADERAKMAKWLGAKSFFMGSLTPIGNQLRLDLRLVNAQSGELLCASSATAGRTEVDSLLRIALNELTQDQSNLIASPVQVQAPDVNLPRMGTLRLRFKIINSFFNEAPIPIQKAQVIIDGKNYGESKLLNKVNQEVEIGQIPIPMGNQVVELRMGSVDKSGHWKKPLADQPPSFRVFSSEKTDAEIYCTEVISDQGIEYKCR